MSPPVQRVPAPGPDGADPPEDHVPADRAESRGDRRPVSDTLDERIASASDYERARLLVDYYRPQVALDPSGWVAELARRVETHDISLPTVRSVTADLAWHARAIGQPYPSVAPPAADAGSARRLVAVYVECQRLRFDYKFERLRYRCSERLQEFPEDALVVALAAFSALAARAPEGEQLYRSAISSPNADRRSRHVCLAGMWLAHHLPNQPQEIIELSNAMMARGEVDPNVFYRRAAALRRLGRFDEALEDIDRAIGLHEVGDNQVHQDYVRERELIVSSRDVRSYFETFSGTMEQQIIAEVRTEIARASDELSSKIETAQRVVSDGLLKIVEILGLFVALIGFIAGSGAVVLRSGSMRERTLSMALVLVGSLLFFVLLRLVTGFRRR